MGATSTLNEIHDAIQTSKVSSHTREPIDVCVIAPGTGTVPRVTSVFKPQDLRKLILEAHRLVNVYRTAKGLPAWDWQISRDWKRRKLAKAFEKRMLVSGPLGPGESQPSASISGSYGAHT